MVRRLYIPLLLYEHLQQLDQNIQSPHHNIPTTVRTFTATRSEYIVSSPQYPYYSTNIYSGEETIYSDLVAVNVHTVVGILW
jgi:hypothetical protein